MSDQRAKITTDVQKIVTNHGLRLRGSWLYCEQHFVAMKEKVFSLSDIDILSDEEHTKSSEQLVRADIEACTNSILLACPSISIRSATVNKDSSQSANHNTLFWAYIALFELRYMRQLFKNNTYCDAESYFFNKFLLNIWRNILLEAGKSPTSYSSILNALDDLSDHDKRGLSLIKRGEYPFGDATSLITRFYDYTLASVQTNSPHNIRSDLLKLLTQEVHNGNFELILGKLKGAAVTKTESEVIAYTQGKVGQLSW